jgi:formate dehydrogenase major subunit
MRYKVIKAKINGIERDFPKGISILQAASVVGIDIPTLCNDERLKPVGACRMCLVLVNGYSREVASCTTELAEGMEVETHGSSIEEARKWNLRMLAQKYPAAAFSEFPEKPFHRLASTYGLTTADFEGANRYAVDDTHTYISVDMSRCIECLSCVRICSDLQGQFVWQVIGRGEDSHIVPNSFTSFGDSGCVSCGACSDVCPTGALEDKSVMRLGLPTNWTRTTCPYCGTGCEMNVGTRDDNIVQVRPVSELWTSLR